MQGAVNKYRLFRDFEQLFLLVPAC